MISLTRTRKHCQLLNTKALEPFLISRVDLSLNRKTLNVIRVVEGIHYLFHFL